MPFIVWVAPFIPFLAMLPPSFAAIWIANRWLRTRHVDAELLAQIAALRDEVTALRQGQAETIERIDFTERMLAQLRETRRELPKASS